ncbi:hydroxyethylthiazole kinase [Gluconacetobacter sp. 1b LMG 1731]|uniref:Hydroxyethylthiazole kinase n=1 Tax=Gluconacetobacter dulcium TaxID=2729096 RepID=A0A7W4IIF6_9PROT|nr:hydroxyethylthiazole kinase [Gluconacetobacter dulcium]MBB2163247.1 hydroxyethylthiazole kinase [Gluconacetobacter dulcium]MBB2192058.1 hydroxyethylthiazole kinase [Gluconacetobacter dulcium]MBB2197622.1 hydroxyethylthiazole kinase [Gluconacetobacter dulcium]
MSNAVFTPDAVATTLERVRAGTPLVHNITNIVAANTTANALLALGASPAMVDAEEEVEAFAAQAAALVVNIGTITAPQAAAIARAIQAAQRAGTPWILDPVAVGALAFRARIALDSLAHAPRAIRGNASEIIALAHLRDGHAEPPPQGRGVDSLKTAEQAVDAAARLARSTGACVVVSGATDHITDGTRIATVANGHPMMTRVTALGCTATALAGACLAVEPDAMAACAHAMVLIGLAGERAAREAAGPGSLQVRLLDALYQLDRNTVTQEARIAILTP